MTLREKIEVMEAFERGEEIEFTFSIRNKLDNFDKTTVMELGYLQISY